MTGRCTCPLLVVGIGFQLFAQEIRTTQVASGIASPTDIQNAADGSGRLFLVQQSGLVRILRNGALVTQPFLDIRSKTRVNGELGLLGIAVPVAGRNLVGANVVSVYVAYGLSF